MKKKFKILTLGCKVNQYESDCLARELADKGYEAAGEGEQADICVLNTCTVTARAAQQSRQALRGLIRDNPGASVAATGCMAQTEPEQLQDIPGVALVAGNQAKDRLAGLLEEKVSSQDMEPLVTGTGKHPSVPLDMEYGAVAGSRSRPFLKIQDGCNTFCTYCTVPKARGRSRSARASQVLAHLAELSEQGYSEVVLTGIHLGAWGKDLEPPQCLAGLLARACATPSLPALRLSSIEPNELVDDILNLAVDTGRIRPHFHLPLQSGSNEILKKMGRPYDREAFSDRARAIRRLLPHAAIGCDVMAGFPGETDSAFDQTMELITKLPITHLHVFVYSPRQGTPAARFKDQVDLGLAKKRATALRRLGQAKKRAFEASLEKKKLWAVVEGAGPEGLVKAVTENYISVAFESKSSWRPGREVRVVLERAGEGDLAKAVLV